MSITGNTLLADAGELSYNGVYFSILFRSSITGQYLPDDAGWTVKLVEYTLEAEGIVSPTDVGRTPSNDVTFPPIKRLLSRAAGQLTYKGRGFGNIVVNPLGGGGLRDAVWGPTPTVLFFQTLGNALSAMVRWKVKFTIPELPPSGASSDSIFNANVVQFSYENALTYDEEGYSGISLRGILEVPLTRVSAQSRAIPKNIVDAFRERWENIQFDLTKFRVVNRSFNTSADLRTCKWEYRVEELPPMDLPPGATKARGSFDIQPLKIGSARILSGVAWSCNLRATYTIRKDWPRRQAAQEFFLLLKYRMESSARGVFPDNVPGNNQQQQPGFFGGLFRGSAPPAASAGGFFQAATGGVFAGQPNAQGGGGGLSSGFQSSSAQALMTHFGVNEGLYLDSRSITFEAGWILFTTFRTLLDAAGVWRWPQNGADYGGLARSSWSASVSSISGWRSWLANQIDPNAEVIVDLGGGQPSSTPLLPGGAINNVQGGGPNRPA